MHHTIRKILLRLSGEGKILKLSDGVLEFAVQEFQHQFKMRDVELIVLRLFGCFLTLYELGTQFCIIR